VSTSGTVDAHTLCILNVGLAGSSTAASFGFNCFQKAVLEKEDSSSIGSFSLLQQQKPSSWQVIPRYNLEASSLMLLTIRLSI
jgi:hypothetical protein